MYHDGMRPKRKNIPPKIKAAVTQRQNGHCAECRTIFTVDDKIEYDHRPALVLRSVNVEKTDYHPPQNDPSFIEALHKLCHLKRTVGRIPGAEKTITVKGSDVWLAAKFRKLEGKNKPKRKRHIAAPTGFPKGRKMQSRVRSGGRYRPHVRLVSCGSQGRAWADRGRPSEGRLLPSPKSRDGTLSAVAIWYDSNDGSLRYQDNGRDVDEMKARERWPYVSQRPISEEIFWQFRETGVWRDIDETATSIHAGKSEGGSSETQIAGKIAEAKKAVPQYLKIESDEAATRAQSLRSTLTGLKGEAKKQYDAMNRPLLDEQKRIRGVWNPIIEDAKTASVQLRTALEDWELTKRKAAQAAEEAGVKPNTPAPSAKISGGMGRSASAKLYTAVISISIDQVYAQFKGDDRIYQLLKGLAQDAIDAGIAVPGAVTEQKVRIR